MEQDDVSNRVLKIFCDYGAEWPLWEHGLQYPSDYGLSESLSNRLAKWNDEFQQHMHWDRGWAPGFDEDAWTETGKKLAHDVQQEVGDRIVVHYEV